MDASKAPAIQLNHLSKRYRSTKQLALNNVSLSVSQGEVYGFLGANGAGKSTTIRTLLNFIQPTGGSAQILGMDIVKKSLDIRHKIGYLAGDVALYDKLTGNEFLKYMCELHPAENAGYVHELTKDFEAPLRQPLGTLSRGNRQKIGVIQALMHEPTVLILDEPTSGLDPLMQEVFFDHIKRARERGASIFLSSHNLAEVQRICDRIGFIDRGKLLREQSLAELVQNAAHTFDVTFTDKAPMQELHAIKNAHIVRSRHDPQTVAASVPIAALPQFFSVLSKYSFKHFDQREVNLEEEFMDFYREATRGRKTD